MADKPKKTLGYYYRPTVEERQSIVPPAVAVSFSIDPELICLIRTSFQFGGLPSEDPNMHLYDFLHICDTFKFDGVSDDAIRLRLFPFSLRDEAIQWLRLLPARSITTWDELVTKFLAKYSPPLKMAKLKTEIATFAQHDSESLYEAWNRFQDLLRRCPDHGLPEWQLAHIFFEGLTPAKLWMLDSAIGGFMTKYKPVESYALMDEMVSNNYCPWQFDRQVMEKQNSQPGVLDCDIAILKQLEALTETVESLKTLVQKHPQPPPLMDELCRQVGLLNTNYQEGNSSGLYNNELDFAGNYMG